MSIAASTPGAAAATRETSKALNSGKHTTTSTTLYWLDAERRSALIDSPGFQEFGLAHIDPMQLAKLMPDLAPLTEHCRFHNCTHRHEPGCELVTAVAAQQTADPANAHKSGIGSGPGPSIIGRYKIYCDLFTELSQPKTY